MPTGVSSTSIDFSHSHSWGRPSHFSALSLNAATSLQTYRGDSVAHSTMCCRSLNTTKRMKVSWTTTTSRSAECLGGENGKEPGNLRAAFGGGSKGTVEEKPGYSPSGRRDLL